MSNKTDTLETTLVAIELLKRIPRNRKISASELHRQLADKGMVRDIRTIQRLLETLSERFDIERDDQSKPYGYRWKELSAGLELPYLSEQESLLLQLAQQQLSLLLPSSMMRSLNTFFEQARCNLNTQANSKLAKQWLSKVRVVSTTQPLLPPNIQPDIFDAVSNALYRNHWLHIVYQNANGEQKQSEIMPLGLAQQGTFLYLIARFKDYDNERSLALHRFISAKNLERTFERPEQFDLQKYDDSGRFGFGDGQYIQLTLKIKKYAGLHIVEAPLSKNQTVTEEGDCYIINATIVDTEILDRWLRGFGDDVLEVTKKKTTD
jgi:predicted DNA-binding transcriptional regulator YafY